MTVFLRVQSVKLRHRRQTKTRATVVLPFWIPPASASGFLSDHEFSDLD
jgi:hypothetical protein